MAHLYPAVGLIFVSPVELISCKASSYTKDYEDHDGDDDDAVFAHCMGPNWPKMTLRHSSQHAAYTHHTLKWHTQDNSRRGITCLLSFLFVLCDQVCDDNDSTTMCPAHARIDDEFVKWNVTFEILPVIRSAGEIDVYCSVFVNILCV